MARTPNEPPRTDFFDGKGRPAAEDALRLVGMGREAQEGDAERFSRGASSLFSGAIENAFQRYREGAVPLEAVEVIAALTAIVRPKDYGCHPVWDVGLALGAIQLEDDGAGRPRRERSREAAAGARIALIGAGGSLRELVAQARPIVFQNQHLGLPWAAMCKAFDAIGAGSHAALERLGAIVDEAGSRPALIWLDEVACRVAREPRRAKGRAAALDRLLMPGGLPTNAAKMASVVYFARKQLAAQEAENHDAWVRIGVGVQKGSARPPVDNQPPEVPIETPAGKAFLRRMDAEIAQYERETRIAEELQGPFFWGWGDEPFKVVQVVDGMLHYALLGFRQLYGLELLGDALPRLAEALQAGEFLGPVN